MMHRSSGMLKRDLVSLDKGVRHDALYLFLNLNASMFMRSWFTFWTGEGSLAFYLLLTLTCPRPYFIAERRFVSLLFSALAARFGAFDKEGFR